MDLLCYYRVFGQANQGLVVGFLFLRYSVVHVCTVESSPFYISWEMMDR